MGVDIGNYPFQVAHLSNFLKGNVIYLRSMNMLVCIYMCAEGSDPLMTLFYLLSSRFLNQ